MASKTDEQIARENRLRLFRQQDGVRAMEDAAGEAIVIRKNMARLRELRLAKEAETALTDEEISKPKLVKPSSKKRIIRD
jgi:hypothetical protein